MKDLAGLSKWLCLNTLMLPLSGSSYIKLPVELKSPKKEQINIKNYAQKCFLWCHVRHTNPVKIHPERITREDKKLVNDLNYDGIEFPVWAKDFSKIKKRIIFALTCFVMKINWFSNLRFRSKIWRLDWFVACNWGKQVTLCVYQTFWRICDSQNKE